MIGYFLQQRELSSNTRAIRTQYEQMRRTAENAEIQARAITSNALHQQQETVLLVADRVDRQLGAVVGLLWMSVRGPGNEDAADAEQIDDLWSRLGSGDPEAFARQFMALYFRSRDTPGAVYDLYFGAEIRTRHSETILGVFGRLLEAAAPCDPDGIIRDALLGSGHGTLYQQIKEQKENPTPGR